jgi:prepilin-type N-terminal cleavage/methylation domain-containing protein
LKFNQQGFTILEVLLATTIMSFLMLGVNSIVSQSSETKDEVTREDRAYLQVYTALNRFEVDFTQIHSPLYYTSKERTIDEVSRDNPDSDIDRDTLDNPNLAYQSSEKFPMISRKGEPIGTIVNEDKSSLIFSTMSNRRKIQDAKEGRFAWVQYSLGKVSPEAEVPLKGEELIRNFTAENPYSKEFDWKNTASQVLLQNVKSILFEFYDKTREKWVDKLSDTGLDKDTPRAVRVTLVWFNESGNEMEFSRTFRPLWPYFDTMTDEKDRQAALKGAGSKDQNLNNNGDRDE